jgi:uncharacterized protein (DUF1015 family)
MPVPEKKVVAALHQDFEIEPLAPETDPVSWLAVEGRQITALVALPGDRVLSLRLRANRPPPAASVAGRLNITKVDRLIVDRLADLAGSQRAVDYSADAPTVLRAATQGHAFAGILVNPTRVEEVLAVADAREVMPPKSTYFIPKVPSGVVLLPLSGAS